MSLKPLSKGEYVIACVRLCFSTGGSFSSVAFSIGLTGKSNFCVRPAVLQKPPIKDRVIHFESWLPNKTPTHIKLKPEHPSLIAIIVCLSLWIQTTCEKIWNSSQIMILSNVNSVLESQLPTMETRLFLFRDEIIYTNWLQTCSSLGISYIGLWSPTGIQDRSTENGSLDYCFALQGWMVWIDWLVKWQLDWLID